MSNKLLNKPSYAELEQRIKHLEEEVDGYRETEEMHKRLELAVHQSINGIAMADMEGTLSYANPAWIRMHGYQSAEEIAGKHLGIFHHADHMQAVQNFIGVTLQKGAHADDHQRLVQFMAHAGRQFTDRRQFAGLNELSLGGF